MRLVANRMTIMVEPTESKGKRELDNFAKIMSEIIDEAYNEPMKVLGALFNTSVSRINEVKGSHPKTLCLSWRMYKRGSRCAPSSLSLERALTLATCVHLVAKPLTYLITKVMTVNSIRLKVTCC